MEVERQPLANFDSSFPFSHNNHQHVDVDSGFSLSFTDSTISAFHVNSEAASVILFPEQKPIALDAQIDESSGGSLVDLSSSSDKSPTEEINGASTTTTTTAALKVQKVYRSYRTRRRLADSAVVAEELWWQALEFAGLTHSTISFYNMDESESVPSRWNRAVLNASKVGKGLSKEATAQLLAFQHWIEAIDPRHRYGHSLHLYYEVWCNAEAGQPFFYWLDIGDGKDVDLKECPRSKLRKQCIKYLGPQEREHYEYIVVDGKIVHKQSGDLLDTTKGSHEAKWIFVMSTFEKLYAGEKKKGIFHHSSFLAGGATLAAGRLVAVDGILKSIWAYSGHYRPTDDNLNNLLDFLHESGVNIKEVEIRSSTEDYEYNGDSKSSPGDAATRAPSKLVQPSDVKPSPLEIPSEVQKHQPSELDEVSQDENRTNYKRTLSGGLQSPRAADVPKKALLQRINSKKMATSYQLGDQVSLKWSTGAGPRIGCVADYPLELRLQAMDLTHFSPRAPPTPSSRLFGGDLSPTSCMVTDLCKKELNSQPLV